MAHEINLVLHPGHSKCGSTSIQTSLYSSIDELEKHSIFVPDSRFQFHFEPAREPADSLHPLWYFQDLMTGSIELSSFERRIDAALASTERFRCETILISSENLCNLYLKHALDFHRVLAAKFRRVQVIYYIRRQDDWILSAWQQWGYRNGKRLETSADYCMRNGLAAFLANARHFQEIYGEDSLSLIPLHRKALPDGGLLVDFYRRLGIDAANAGESGEHLNVSLNPYLCETLAASGAALPADENAFRELLDRSCPRELLYRKYRYYMSNSLRNHILDFYEDENRELHRRFFGSLKYDEVFGRRADPAEADQARERLEGFRDALSVQMGLLLSLMREGE